MFYGHIWFLVVQNADVFATPTEIDNIPRPPDDFQPRAQIKKVHNSGALKLEDEQSLRTGMARNAGHAPALYSGYLKSTWFN
jgi:hypothetical protein